MPQFTFLLTVKAIIKETKDTTTLIFERSPHLDSYQAGQFITLLIPKEKEIIRRSYSLCTYPSTDAYPAITIKRVLGGKVSNYLHSDVQIGDRLEALQPTGNFVLPEVLPKPYHGVFIAGGSGIAPIFSLMKALLYRQDYTWVLLIYANRNEESIIYAKMLKDLKTKYRERIQIVHVLSSPSDTWEGPHGRLTSSKLEDLVTIHELEANVHYFLCGPEGLMELARTTLTSLGVASHHIHQESFVVKKKEHNPVPVTSQLKICYEGEEYACEVDDSTTLLDAALQEGIDIPFSCGSGMCNSCRAKCTKGRVRMLEDEGLTQEEIDQGYVLTCVGYAASEQVTLEVE